VAAQYGYNLCFALGLVQIMFNFLGKPRFGIRGFFLSKKLFIRFSAPIFAFSSKTEIYLMQIIVWVSFYWY
jgi:hypothetical protein